jgi:hypothetical protein
MQTVPCILHLENCVGLKQLKMLIVKGLSNAKEGTILPEMHLPIKRKNEYVKQLEEIMNEVLLAKSYIHPGGIVPTMTKAPGHGPVSFKNDRIRKVIAI